MSTCSRDDRCARTSSAHALKPVRYLSIDTGLVEVVPVKEGDQRDTVKMSRIIYKRTQISSYIELLRRLQNSRGVPNVFSRRERQQGLYKTGQEKRPTKEPRENTQKVRSCGVKGKQERKETHRTGWTDTPTPERSEVSLP